MKTIEERAHSFACLNDKPSSFFSDLEKGYLAGASEQKAIDNEELLKLKSAWEKQAQINHNDEDNYNQGYHDAVEKACKWLKENVEGGVHPQSAHGFADRFRKAMEE